MRKHIENHYVVKYTTKHVCNAYNKKVEKSYNDKRVEVIRKQDKELNYKERIGRKKKR